MVLSARKAKLLGDLTVLLSQSLVDWGSVLGMVDRYSLEPGLYYVLSYLSQSIGVPVPNEVLESLRKRLGRQTYHDWGDFLPKLLGVRPTFELTV
jgi:hypothetical protein